jgi:hypothetical protein
MPHVACFITPHGYGHAARAAATITALHQRVPDATFDLYTHVPRTFFDQSLDAPFDYHPLLSDIGLVQHDALHEDVPETIRHLDAFLPFDPPLIQRMADHLQERGTTLAICDIAPMGILIAEAAGVPSILVENFTWDWIYEAYSHDYPQIVAHAAYLGDCFARADHHIQTEPICKRTAADLVTHPVAREPRTPRNTIRKQLGLAPERHMVLISMGGIPEQHGFLDALRQVPDTDFVLPGTVASVTHRNNTVELPHASSFYHPDLVNAADCVIGKVGYSTISEVFHSGIPFGYVSRPHFRESPPLARFIDKHMPSAAITPASFRSGAWITDSLPRLLDHSRQSSPAPNGADQIAAFAAECIQ